MKSLEKVSRGFDLKTRGEGGKRWEIGGLMRRD